MEQNTLTELLQLAGYTDSNYPEYVKIPEGSYGKEKLDNIYGGFEFRTDYLVKRNYRTGCGLSVKFENCIRHMSYMGIEWCGGMDIPYRSSMIQIWRLPLKISEPAAEI